MRSETELVAALAALIPYAQCQGCYLAEFVDDATTDEERDEVQREFDECAAAIQKAIALVKQSVENDAIPPEAVESYLIASTAHLSEKDRQFFEGTSPCERVSGLGRVGVTYRSEYGWLLYIRETDGDDELEKEWASAGEGLRKLVELAEGAGLLRIMIDADGPIIPGVPIYEEGA